VVKESGKTLNGCTQHKRSCIQDRNFIFQRNESASAVDITITVEGKEKLKGLEN
jgi:hypothetical protein